MGTDSHRVSAKLREPRLTSDDADAGGLPATPRAVILHKPFDMEKPSAPLAAATGRAT